MRTRIFLPFLLVLLLLPIAARAVDQETIDRFIFLLQQPEGNPWGDGTFDDAVLLEGLGAIYAQAVADEDDVMLRRVIWAMGETGLVDFVPSIVESLDPEPVVACYALGKIASEDGVNALIGMLDNEDMQVRDAAVWGLGNVPYQTDMEQAREDALAALNARIPLEEEAWVLEDINAAITFIETGIAVNESFAEPVDTN
jgi:hypothetical protein